MPDALHDSGWVDITVEDDEIYLVILTPGPPAP